MLGSWTTSKIVATNADASTGSVVASPSALRNHGQDFGVWLRSLLLAYTPAFAGYPDSTGPFRFVSTDLTVPARQFPPRAAARRWLPWGATAARPRGRT